MSTRRTKEKKSDEDMPGIGFALVDTLNENQKKFAKNVKETLGDSLIDFKFLPNASQPYDKPKPTGFVAVVDADAPVNSLIFDTERFLTSGSVAIPITETLSGEKLSDEYFRDRAKDIEEAMGDITTFSKNSFKTETHLNETTKNDPDLV